MNKMAGDMHGRERRSEAMQTARDKNVETRRDTPCPCKTIQSDTASVKTTNFEKKKKAQRETTYRVTAKTGNHKVEDHRNSHLYTFHELHLYALTSVQSFKASHVGKYSKKLSFTCLAYKLA